MNHFSPEPAGGAYSAPPDPIAGLRGWAPGKRRGKGERNGERGGGWENKERREKERGVWASVKIKSWAWA